MSESIVDILSQGRDHAAQASKIYGLVVGIVTNNKDPDKLGRIKVKFPWLDDKVESWWARIAQPMGGKERGHWWIPEVDDEVLVGFDHGDVRFPYIVGTLYNGVDKPPVCNDVTSTFAGTEYDYGAYSTSGRDLNEDGKNDLRFIRSRSGHLVVLDDKDGKEKVTITDKTGAHRIEIFTDKKKVVITSSDGDVEICAEKKVKITCEDFELHSRKSTTMNVDTDMAVTVKQNLTEKVKQSISRKSDMDTKQEAGTSMDLKAGTSATMKAGTTGEVSAGATLKCSSPSSTFSGDAMCTVKGGMVMIN
jgi:uncharacterized protein involved in type VI secretion and phage assembly